MSQKVESPNNATSLRRFLPSAPTFFAALTSLGGAAAIAGHYRPTLQWRNFRLLHAGGGLAANSLLLAVVLKLTQRKEIVQVVEKKKPVEEKKGNKLVENKKQQTKKDKLDIYDTTVIKTSGNDNELKRIIKDIIPEKTKGLPLLDLYPNFSAQMLMIPNEALLQKKESDLKTVDPVKMIETFRANVENINSTDNLNTLTLSPSPQHDLVPSKSLTEFLTTLAPFDGGLDEMATLKILFQLQECQKMTLEAMCKSGTSNIHDIDLALLTAEQKRQYFTAEAAAFEPIEVAKRHLRNEGLEWLKHWVSEEAALEKLQIVFAFKYDAKDFADLVAALHK